ncbi:HNH endonuclease [Leptospirillum ferriphilum]|uniref:HNH endonuclease n=1 Tax=Leptospirillum ferriphilum TaxID=178606 RepID=UPI0015C2C8C8|nr:HNH endonuclease [Leptospirillum ferriphilum]
MHSDRHGRNTYCALCFGKITNKNRSKEHLFPNAIGGRLKIPDFICNNCNKISGSKWDKSLTDQLNIFSVFFGISRERGSPPPETVETTTGEKLLLHSKGGFSPTKPTLSENKTEQGTQIQIKARTQHEARNMLLGLKRKYPNIDPEELLKTAQKKFPLCKEYDPLSDPTWRRGFFSINNKNGSGICS